MHSTKEQQTPMVCVGMPVYNGEKYIKEAIDSLLLQTFTDFELIISDNASEDQTQKICEEYINRDQRIRYVRHAKNMGSIANFNYLLDHSKGKYFTWLACDDLLEPHFLEKSTQYLEQFDDVIACTCDFKVINQKNELLKFEYLNEIYPHLDWSQTWEYFFKFPISNVYFTIYGLFRRTELERFHIKMTTTWIGLNSGTEIPFLARLAAKGKIISLSQVLRIYRIHEESVFNLENSNSKLIYRRHIHNLLLAIIQMSIAFTANIPFLVKVKFIKKFFKKFFKKFINKFILHNTTIVSKRLRQYLSH